MAKAECNGVGARPHAPQKAPVAADRFCCGMVARSLAGRDAGGWFVVAALTADGHALIVDGKLHPIRRPKRKKCKHLAPTNTVWDLGSPAPWSDKKLYARLSQFGREAPATGDVVGAVNSDTAAGGTAANTADAVGTASAADSKAAVKCADATADQNAAGQCQTNGHKEEEACQKKMSLK